MLSLTVTIADAQSRDYGMAIRYIGEHPGDAEPVFADNIQGITTDGSYWYVTQTEDLWKFPLQMNWDDVDDGVSSVWHTEMDNYVDGNPHVHSAYIHMGDLSYHNFCGRDVLIVPLHNGANHPSAMLVLRASDLGPIGWQEFGGLTLGSWCAVDDEGDVYFPGSSYDKIVRYSLDCGQLANNLVQFNFVDEPTLLDEDGNPVARRERQGAVFSPDGELFVHAIGTGGSDFSDSVLDGVHMFDTSTWRRIAHSTNGYGLFNFQWNNDDEEPEGIVWFDLDNAGVRGMAGQLHILLLNNDNFDSDNIFFKHYTSRIYVDAASSGGNGTVGSPFPTVGQAASLAWNGSEVRIKAGTYNDEREIVFDKRTRLIAHGGTVSIGDP